MKLEKGITLISLVLYIIVTIAVIGILSVISTHFYSNTSYVTDVEKFTVEFNKFNMYFIEDVKNNTNLYNITENKIIFEDGITYTYTNGSIYRNKVEICKNISRCTFKLSEETDINNFTKKIINVKLLVQGSEGLETENNYVLKYW